MLADALKAFSGFIQVTLQNIFRCQWCPVHTSPSYTWYLTSCLLLIESFSLCLYLHSHSLPPSYQIVITWLCLPLSLTDHVSPSPALRVRPFCSGPSYHPDPHVDAPWRFEGHSSSQDSRGPSGTIMGLMTGGPFLSYLCFLGYSETDPVICPRKKGLCWGEKGH